MMFRMIAGILRAAADVLDGGYRAPDEPPFQYPVGTAWVKEDGEILVAQPDGTWEQESKLKRDSSFGEAIKRNEGWEQRLAAALDTYYEGIYPEEDLDSDEEIDAKRVREILEDMRSKGFEW